MKIPCSRFTYHDKQNIHSSRILISYFHWSRKLKPVNPVSRKNPFHPLTEGRVLHENKTGTMFSRADTAVVTVLIQNNSPQGTVNSEY